MPSGASENNADRNNEGSEVILGHFLYFSVAIKPVGFQATSRLVLPSTMGIRTCKVLTEPHSKSNMEGNVRTRWYS